MAISDVAAAGGALLKVADSIQSLGNRYYQTSADWQGFRSKVPYLQACHKSLQDQLNKYGIWEDLDPNISGALTVAKELLEEQQGILQEREAGKAIGGLGRLLRINPCCGRVGDIVFPAKVVAAIDSAIEAYGRVPEYFRLEQENDQVFRSRLERKPIPLSFRKDCQGIYVPLEAEAKVYAALEKSDGEGPFVVLLFGPSGTGKSVVARQVGATYKEDLERKGRRGKDNDEEGKGTTQEREQRKKGKMGKSKQSQSGMDVGHREDKRIFDHVVRLDCGREVDAQGQKMVLLQKLGWKEWVMNTQVKQMELFQKPDLSEDTEAKSNQGVLKASLEMSIQSDLNAYLKSLLEEQRLLIVVDNLWDPGFLRDLLNRGGRNVKYLVTSQNMDLCKDLNCKFNAVEIDKLQQDASKIIAKKILSVHAGFSNEVIPDHLKDIADKILDKAGGIPAVIATVGAQIGSADNNDFKIWSWAFENFSKCLDFFPSKVIHGVEEKKSYWSAMKQSIHNLNDEKKKDFLVLLGMCKGPSVPQYILEVFYDFLFPERSCNQLQFSQWEKQLVSWQLVYRESSTLLSIHDLTKDYVLEQERKTIENIECLFLKSCSVVHSSASSVEKSRVVSVLVYLYLDKTFSQSLASQMGHTLDTFTTTKQKTIEPIIKLLALQLNSSKIKADLYVAAIQVFLKFTLSSALDHDHILQLLHHSDGVMDTLHFLENAALLEGSFWQDNIIGAISYGLLELFKDSTHPIFQIQGAKTLAALCTCNITTRDMIVNIPGMLDQLVQSLSQDKNLDLQQSAAFLLCRATEFAGTETALQIVKFENMLNMVVQPLAAEYHDSILQTLLAIALRNLARFDLEVLGTLVNFPNLLQHLNLSLLKDQNPFLQLNAAAALANLGCGDQPFKAKILKLPGLLDSVIKCLEQEQNSGLAEQASRVVRNLTTTDDPTMQDELTSCYNLLQSLAISLSKTHNQLLQLHTAVALANMGCRNQSLKAKLFRLPGLLESLVKCVEQDQNSILAVQAARAICTLAATEELPMKEELASFHNLLQSLTTSLSKVHNQPLQFQVAVALENFGYGSQHLKSKILKFPGLLELLVKCVEQDQNFGLAEQAARAICTFTTMEDSTVKDELASFHNLLQSLATSLSKAHNQPLQLQAAVALTNLGCRNQSLKAKIFKLPGLLESLVKCVEQDQNSILAVQAARAICTLAATQDSTMKDELASFHNLLQSLATSLSKVDNRPLQLQVATTLGILGSENQSLKAKILKLPGLLDRLAECTEQDQSSGLAEIALCVSHILTAAED